LTFRNFFFYLYVISPISFLLVSRVVKLPVIYVVGKLPVTYR